jgi:tetratricopeptide (TPR) repeat protein
LHRNRLAAWLLGGLLAGAVWPTRASAFANVAVGEVVQNVTLETIDGRRHDLLSRKAKANVFVFFRPQQEHSLDTLQAMARCEKELAAKPVHWVAVVSDSWTRDEVKEVVAQSGIAMPVLVDAGDALYGRLGVRLHPVIGIVDAKGKLAAYEPFREINYCDRVRARILWVLGEMTDADVAKVDEPERAVTRTDAGVAMRHVNFARHLHRIEKDDKALAEIDRSLAVFPTAAAYVLRGQILAGRGDCAGALAAYDAAVKIDPKEPSALEGTKACGRGSQP